MVANESAKSAKKILDSILGSLGIPFSIEIEENKEEICLQIFTSQSQILIGKNGDRLDDLQYLVNRILRKKLEDAPRIRVDCEHYRSIQEDKLLNEIFSIVERVRETGKEVQLRPLNSYYRRIVHNSLVNEKDIESISPDKNERYKRMTLRLKKQ